MLRIVLLIVCMPLSHYHCIKMSNIGSLDFSRQKLWKAIKQTEIINNLIEDLKTLQTETRKRAWFKPAVRRQYLPRTNLIYNHGKGLLEYQLKYNIVIPQFKIKNLKSKTLYSNLYTLSFAEAMQYAWNLLYQKKSLSGKKSRIE